MLRQVLSSACVRRVFSPSPLARAQRCNAHSLVSLDNINANVREAKYAVRGAIVAQALKMEKEIQSAKSSGRDSPYSFANIIYSNIGNPQSLKQKPITFFRQVMAAIEYPALLDQGVFPSDVADRARKYLAEAPNGTGAYTHSQGLQTARREVADFIDQRDGTSDCDPDNIFLSNGASAIATQMMQVLVRGTQDGVMIPVPQYPLYSGTLTLLGGTAIPYYLDEDARWSITMQDLSNFEKTKPDGVETRALVVINPGNPTGQCLARPIMEEIVEFCAKNKIVLFADEVYQENIYQPETAPFHSFRSIYKQLGATVSDLQLVSLHSVSKGFIGECGKRGGYGEVIGLDPDVVQEVYKLASLSLCSNATGQIMAGLMTNPPKPGDESYELYQKERDDILSSLKRRAMNVVDALNKLEGVSCQPASSSMYAFPQITVPQKAVAKAKEMKVAPDFLYCMDLLKATGIVVVPGSGFLQKEGTFHFRTTFLPPEDEIEDFTDRISGFHGKWMQQYK